MANKKKVVRKIRKSSTTDTPQATVRKRTSKPPKVVKASSKSNGKSKTVTDEAPRRNTGVTSGMRIMAFQDHTLAVNHKTKLTDAELAALWSTEFPQSTALQRQDPKIVQGVRSLYNAGRHSSAQGGIPPSRKSVRYDADGNKAPGRASKATTTPA